MILKKQYYYLFFTLLIYLMLTLPGWVRAYSNFSSNSYLGYCGPVLAIFQMLVWVSLHNLFLIDRLAVRGHYINYTVLLILGIITMAYIQQAISRPYNLYWAGINIFIHTSICTAVYMSISYVDQKKNFYKQSLLSKEMELNRLKAQLNPHFLFNSLNNIYSYNLENNTKGNDLILKLSQLMRYVVEAEARSVVALGEELQFIVNYVDFERERLGYRCDIQFNTVVSDNTIPITPLLFFPLVENAFKHGTATNSRSDIIIDILQKDKLLDVSVVNSIAGSEQKDSTQVGLGNVKRRLELLYPGHHKLSVENSNGLFRVNLNVTLK